VDPIGTLLLFLVGFGWAKPVPVNPLNFHHPGRDNALVSFAGPGSNLLCAVVFGLILRSFAHNVDFATISQLGSNVIYLLYSIVTISLVLAFFNLIPIPPLDGSHILREFLPEPAQRSFDQVASFGPILLVAFLLVSSFTGLISSILLPAVDFLFTLITGF
jgi:Zn-dependent protease